MVESKITLPHLFEPRPYQVAPFAAFDAVKRKHSNGVLVVHRRGGKTKVCVNILTPHMWRRVGAYYHLFPTYEQGKKAVWEGRGRDGIAYLDHFPEALRMPDSTRGKNENELKITFRHPEQTNKPGSIYRIIGTKDLNKIRGTNPLGVIIDEWPHHNPEVLDILSPIMRENGGFIIFAYTPYGKNHGKTTYELARDNPDDYFCQLLTVEQTHHKDGRRIITEEDLAAERKRGMPEEMIQQEYFCSFEGFMVGTYYGDNMTYLQKEGYIGEYAWEPEWLVDTWWDIGVDDTTAIWFVQQKPGSNVLHIIDCYENTGFGVLHYIEHLRNKPYRYCQHIGPHDLKQREWAGTDGTSVAKARWQIARDQGIIFRVLDRMPVQDGIDAVRRLLPRCRFDQVKCKSGISALENYHKKYNTMRQEFEKVPFHDWSSNFADAMRTGAMGHKETKVVKQEVEAVTEFDPLEA